MRHEITLPLNCDYDSEYGRWDIAPRIMGQHDVDGETGWLLGYLPNRSLYLVVWDSIKSGPEYITKEDFVILNGVVA